MSGFNYKKKLEMVKFNFVDFKYLLLFIEYTFSAVFHLKKLKK